MIHEKEATPEAQESSFLSKDVQGRSLPLRKRKYRDELNATHQPPTKSHRLTFETESMQFSALLALVAAAEATATLESSPSTCDIDTAVALEEQSEAKTNFSMCHPVSPEHRTPSPHAAISPALTATTLPRQRVHHPPLWSPLPNGCHGRTSRNNSFCRRRPCYNGSNYCKLHYHQYVAGKRTHSEEMPVIQQATSRSSQQQHQDKRFTGLLGEIRCEATTTRGRACAYVAVNGSKYCNLHRDYDTNPPPRRASSRRSQSATCSYAQSDVRFGATTLWGLDGSSHLGNGAATSSMIGRSVSEAIQDREVYPVLSSISSDRWMNQQVLIISGPLINHTGHVVKWGNGWVSVLTCAGGTNSASYSSGEGLVHNRRSAELVILPKTEISGKEIAEALPSIKFQDENPSVVSEDEDEPQVVSDTSTCTESSSICTSSCKQLTSEDEHGRLPSYVNEGGATLAQLGQSPL